MRESAPEANERLQDAPDAAKVLMRRALRLLARREHSRAELLSKLGGPSPEMAAVLDALALRGWLSEGRCAEQLIASAAGRYGPRRLEQKLRQRQVAEATVEGLRDRLREGELENARALLTRRYSGPPANAREHARQARFLAGRGFRSATIARLLGAGGRDE